MNNNDSETTGRKPFYSEQDRCYLVPLTQERFAKIDEEDVPIASQTSWHFNDKGYARSEVKGKMTYLHRIIMQAPSDMQVDHANGDRLDNRRSNLRLCHHAQNTMNAGIRTDNTSGYMGVTKRSSGRWGAYINHNGRRINLGTYDTPEEAASIRDSKAKTFRGTYARLNFDQKGIQHEQQ